MYQKLIKIWHTIIIKTRQDRKCTLLLFYTTDNYYQQHFLSAALLEDFVLDLPPILMWPWLDWCCDPARTRLSFRWTSSTIFSNAPLTFSPVLADVKKFKLVFWFLQRERMVSCSISRGRSLLLPMIAHAKLSGSQGIMLDWRFSIHSWRFWKLSISSTLYMRMAAEALR